MKNALAFAAAGTLVLIGVGWYLGWYSVKTTKNSDGTHNVNIGIDDHKVKQDVEKGIEKGEKFAKDIEEKNSKGSDAPAGSADPSKLNSISPISPPKVEVPRFELPKASTTDTTTRDNDIPTFDLPPLKLPPGR
jgi:hypothetical protein